MFDLESMFTEHDGWILPTSGTRGNKDINLHENTPIIRSIDGLWVPRSLSLPYEYLDEFRDHDAFVGAILDRYFPGLKRVALRSNAPDEDLLGRNPGLYKSEEMWNSRAGDISFAVANVQESYWSLKARAVRFTQGVEAKAMSLLIQEPVTNDREDHSLGNVINSGSFSDQGDFYEFVLAHSFWGIEAMTQPPMDRIKFGKNETYQGPFPELVEKLRQLVGKLPQRQGQNWEVEFVTDDRGTAIVQTTPITEPKPVRVLEEEPSIFYPNAVVGTNELVTDGILYTSSELKRKADEIRAFNAGNRNYCVATVHAALNTNAIRTRNYVLDYVTNASALLDITRDGWGNRFAPHVAQWMREGRIAMMGFWTYDEFKQQMPMDDLGFSLDRQILYSPTRLRIAGIEHGHKGIVQIVGQPQPFREL